MQTLQLLQRDSPGTEDAGEGQLWRVSPAGSKCAFRKGPWLGPKTRSEGRGGRRSGAQRCVHSTETDRAQPRGRTWDLIPNWRKLIWKAPARPFENRMKLTSPNLCSSSVNDTGMKSRWEN